MCTLLAEETDEELVEPNREHVLYFLVSQWGNLSRRDPSQGTRRAKHIEFLVKPPSQVSPLTNEEIENMFSIWPDKILVGFLGQKCTHHWVSRQNTAPIEFLAEFCQKLGRVYGALGFQDRFDSNWLL